METLPTPPVSSIFGVRHYKLKLHAPRDSLLQELRLSLDNKLRSRAIYMCQTPPLGRWPGNLSTHTQIWMAMLYTRQHQHIKCIEICSRCLRSDPLDQAAIYLKCNALLEQSWVDDTELEHEVLSDLLLDLNRIAAEPRFRLFSYLAVLFIAGPELP